MKFISKLISGLLVTAFWLTFYSAPALATQNGVVFTINSNHYTINGQLFTMDVAPVIQNSRTLVPLRYLANSLGISNDNINWNAETQQVTLTLSNGDTILAIIGSNKLNYNSDSNTNFIQMDTTPVIINNRVYLPARYLAQALGYTVSWDAQNQQVIITNQDTDNSSSSNNNSTSMATYNDPVNNVSFSYPSDLTKQASTNGSTTFENEIFLVSYFVTPTIGVNFDADSMKQIMQETMQETLLNATSITMESFNNITIDSLPGYVITCSATNTEGTDADFSMYCVEANNNIFGWIFGVYKDDYNNYAQTITNIVNSIKINTSNTSTNNNISTNQTFTDPNNNVSFQYPATWTKAENTANPPEYSVQFFNPSDKEVAITYIAAPLGQESSESTQLIEQLLLGRLSTISGFSNIDITSTNPVTIANINGTETDATVTVGGLNENVSIYMIESNGVGLLWLYEGSADGFANNQQVISNLLNSVTLN